MRPALLAFALPALLLLAGSVQAAESADLSTRATLHVPEGARVDAAWSALFCGALAPGDTLRFTSPRVRVERHERSRVQTGPVVHYVDHEASTFALTDVELVMTRADGWLGASPFAPDARLVVDEAAPLGLSPREAGVVGNWRGSDAEAETLPDFAREVRAHVAAHAPLTGWMAGAVSLKVFGATVSLDAEQNATTVRTGSSAAPAGGLDTWLVLHLEDAHGTFDVAEPCALAARTLAIDTEAPWRVPAATGVLVQQGEAREVDREAVLVEGRMRATLHVEEGEGPRLRVALAPLPPSDASGEPQALLRLPPSGSWQPWLAAFALLALLAAGVRMPRATVVPELTLEQCVDLLNAAAAAGRYGNALEWTRQALTFAPRSPRLKMDEAWFLWELGEGEAAAVACDAALQHGADAETFFIAAVLLKQAGEADRARGRLLQALELEPCLALEVSDEPLFADLRNEPGFARALAEALGRCE